MKRSPECAARSIEDAREYAFEQWVRLWVRRQMTDRGAAAGEGILSLMEDGLRPESSGSLAFPPQDIAGAESLDGGAVRLRLHFLGLTGASSPLPSFLIDDLARARENAEGLRDFLRVFERRLYLVYAWVILQRKIWVRAEFDRFDALLSKLLAWADGGEAHEDERRGRCLRGMALLGSVVRSARGLRRYLALQLSETKIEVDDRGDLWVENPSPAKLGRARLGGETAIGRRIHVAGEVIAVRIGPLAWDRFQEYARDRAVTQARIANLMKDYLERPRTWQVVIELDSATAPRGTTILGAQMRLGRHAWIGGEARNPTRLAFSSAIPDGVGPT